MSEAGTDPRIWVAANALSRQYPNGPDPALWSRDAAAVVAALDDFAEAAPALSDDDDPRVAVVDAILHHRFRRRTDVHSLAGVARQVVAAIDWHDETTDDEIGTDEHPMVLECTVITNTDLGHLLRFAFIGVEALGGGPANPGYVDDHAFLARVCGDAGLDGYTIAHPRRT